MHILETRLTGRQATLAGIVRALNQHMGQMLLARVELRYSTRAAAPLSPQAAKLAIANLLRENGLGQTQVSVHPHAGPIDDATGEHLLRLIPQVQADPGALTSAPPRGWRAWLPEWLAVRLPGARLADPARARDEPGQRSTRPPVSATQAVRKLREAVAKSTAFIETATGTAIVGNLTDQAQAVGLAQITVRLDALHEVLAPLVQQDRSAIAQMVKSAGLVIASDFQVTYHHEPAQAGDGTNYANESDVEVRLVIGTPTATCAWIPAPPSGTALPSPETALPLVPAGPLVTVRVLGTMARMFAQPFELAFNSLPARFDRHALEQAGFDKAHPGLLSVASNSCPLLLQAGQPGGVRLHATCRTLPGLGEAAMYFDAATLAGLRTTVALPSGGARLVVNSPGGVVDVASGQRLPALLIEVQHGRGPVAS